MSTFTKTLIQDLKANSKGIITIFFLFLGIVLKEFFSETTTLFDLGVDFMIILIFFGAYALQIWVLGDSKNTKIDELVGFYTSKLSEAKDWYYSHERLSQIEKEFCTKNMDTIWVASSNLDYEKNKSPFFEAIKDNLKDGISYYYIIPKEKYEDLKKKINTLTNFCKNSKTKGQIKFVPIDEKGLFLFLSNIVIYNDKATGEPTAFKELQIDDNIEKRAWVRINENNPDFSRLISKFEQYISESN